MIRVVLLLVLIGALLWGSVWLKRWWKKQPLATQKRLRRNAIFWVLLGLLVLLTVTGRLNVLLALGGTVFLFLGRLQGVIGTLVQLKRLFGKKDGFRCQDHQPSPRTTGMTVAQACDVLGVSENASLEEIQQAYRRLMSKVHPDRGGSNYLAEQINEAREVLSTRHQS